MRFEIGDTVRVMRADWNRMGEAILIETKQLMGEAGIVADAIYSPNEDDDYIKVNFNRPGIKACRDENKWFWFSAKSLDLVEKYKPKYWTGKVVCTEYVDPIGLNLNFLTVGQVYNVKNGTLIDNKASAWLNNIEDINDLNHRSHNAKFIEFKGFNE